MRTSTRVSAYGAVLAAAFAGAFGIGSLTGGPGVESEPRSTHQVAAESAPQAEVPPPSGLQVSEAGYSLSPLTAPTTPGQPGTLSFRILGPDGRAVTDFTRAHEKDLHLIVVRIDTTEYRHVHPTLSADGTWSIPWQWRTAGTYKIFADFVPAGRSEGLTLARTFTVAGPSSPAPPPMVADVSEVAGYTVTVNGSAVAGGSSRLTATIERNGEPVTTLEPYLGAYGHLVALRDGDLAYLHVHPEGEPGDGVTVSGPDVSFAVEIPTPGAYRLFLDFQVAGEVHTADFTVVATGSGAAGDPDHGEH